MPNSSWRAWLGRRLVFGWASCTHSQVRNPDHTLQPSPVCMLEPATHPPIAHYYIRAWHARMVVASGVDETVFPIVVQCIVSVPLTCHPDFLSPFLSRHSLPMCPPRPRPAAPSPSSQAACRESGPAAVQVFDADTEMTSCLTPAQSPHSVESCVYRTARLNQRWMRSWGQKPTTPASAQVLLRLLPL